MLLTVGVLLAVLAATGNSQQPQRVPTLPRVESVSTNGVVQSIVRSGNRVFLGGSFTLVSPTTGPLTVLDQRSGRLRRSLPRVEGSVSVLAADGAGGFYLAGSFSRVGGFARGGLAHVLADGRVDPAFSPRTDASATSLVAGGGRVFIAGAFKTVNGRSRNGLAAVDANTGEVVPGFDPNPTGDVRTLAFSGGRLYVGGSFSVIAGSGRSNLAALNPDTGAVDPGFDPAVANPGAGGAGRPADVTGSLNMLVVAAGRLYVGGEFTAVGRTSRRNLAAMSPATGALEPEFDPAPAETVHALAHDGARLFFANASAGTLAAVDGATGQDAAGFRRVDTDGFGPTKLAVGSGIVYLAHERGGLRGFDAATGGRRSDFEPAVVGGDMLALLAAGDDLVIGGAFAGAGGERRDRVAALDTSDGSLTPFAPRLDGAVRELKVASGRLFLRGSFRRVQGRPRSGLASLSPATGKLGQFAPRIPGAQRILPVGRRVYVGGRFRRVGRVRQRALVALSARTGRVDRRYRPRISPRRRRASANVNALAVRGGRLYVGGAFSRVNGRRRSSLAALSTRRGRLVRSFRGSVAARSRRRRAQIVDLHLIGSRLFVGGRFSRLSGSGRSGFGAISARSGRLDRRFQPPEPVSVGPVIGLRNRIYMTDFTGSVDELSPRSGRLLRRFSLDSINGQVLALAPFGSNLFAGGSFVGSSPATNAPGRISRLVRFDLAPGATQ